ncbi:4609_t:CDS:2 [Gigaspora rosea]|nr:4609_t:CDS:2 [Gigaspora rosea]
MASEIHTFTKKGCIQHPAYNLVAQWVLDAWNNLDPALIRKSFKCYGISNSRDGKEDHLIFDYDQLGPQTNSRNYIYNQDEIGEGSSTNTAGGSSTNTAGSSSTNTAGGSSTNAEEGFSDNTNESEQINLISDDDNDEDGYYNVEEADYVNEWN